MRILIDGQTLLTPDINRGIGTYFKNILEHVLEQDFGNEYYINTAEDHQLKYLSSWARERIHPLPHQAYHPQTLNRGRGKYYADLYSETLNEDLQKNRIDLYWTPNPLMSNLFLPRRKVNCRFAATIYDLIVLVMKSSYLDKWPSSASAAYLEKLKLLESDYDLYLHISRHTKSDFERHLKVKARQHVVTHLAASDFFYPDPFPVVAAGKSYVLYIGGFDPRKNMDRAIEAFANLQQRYGSDESIRRTELYIVCNFDEVAKEALQEKARNCGVEGKVTLKGFVDDDALRSLYQKARGLFFPSLYEGFGLPLLEALACGLPVASSNTSSLPEVGGEFTTYFDPYKINEMADSLYQTLQAPMDYQSRRRRYEYSKKFSWQETARTTLQAFAECGRDIEQRKRASERA